MKKYCLSFLIILGLLILSGCHEKNYSTEHSFDEIESIEIVSAESSLDFVVIKKLSETEKEGFLEHFQNIKFDRYYLGDPMSVAGNAVKITYENGDYEMICHYWSEYVKEGEIYFKRMHCNEEEFNELLTEFLNGTEDASLSLN